MDILLGEWSRMLADVDGLIRSMLWLLAAMLLGAVAGMQRELIGKSAGLRTHILVSLGTALSVMAAAEAGMSLEARLSFPLSTLRYPPRG